MLKRMLIKIPTFYKFRIIQLRIIRTYQNLFTKFARNGSNDSLPYTCKKHQSLLRRRLGSSDPQLQENKITNLKLAIKNIDGILINPGDIFSFWDLVGEPSAKKGYIEGLLLSQGEVKSGVGGGLCQLANLLFWLALHTPLEIKERHHHSFDPFPDETIYRLCYLIFLCFALDKLRKKSRPTRRRELQIWK